MIDTQQENGTDEAPERDVRWEGKLARLENKAHEHNRLGLDWKTVEVEAGVLERILIERQEYQIEAQGWSARAGYMVDQTNHSNGPSIGVEVEVDWVAGEMPLRNLMDRRR